MDSEMKQYIQIARAFFFDNVVCACRARRTSLAHASGKSELLRISDGVLGVCSVCVGLGTTWVTRR